MSDKTVGLQVDPYQAGVIGDYDRQRAEAERAAAAVNAALAWRIGASLLQLLIGLKAIEASVQAEIARREAAVISYTQTVQTAFRETR